MGQDDILLRVIERTLESSREYRQMAREYMAKADELEGMALKVAIDAQHQTAARTDLEALKEKEKIVRTEKEARDVFEDFGDLFTKKGSKK